MDIPSIDALHDAIRHATGHADDIVRLKAVGGGSISQACIAETSAGKWFVKLNRAGLLEMFEAEADGLRALAECREVRVPSVVDTGLCGDHAYLLLEHVDMHPLPHGAVAAAAGRALAALHRIAGRKFGSEFGCEFGWIRNNLIGSTPQRNRLHGDWAAFFGEERLLPQLALVRARGGPAALIDKGERLAARLSTILGDHRPEPSLLHGDLWGGNAAVDSAGKLVLFDPAVYVGDREADLAMTELFGGFPPEFQAAYRDAWPLADGYPRRRTLYNLYHVLNDFNLFGGGYGRQAERMIDALLADADGGPVA